MKKLDLYWKSRREWWEFRNHVQIVKDDAPIEAKESYKRYIAQVKAM